MANSKESEKLHHDIHDMSSKVNTTKEVKSKQSNRFHIDADKHQNKCKYAHIRTQT